MSDAISDTPENIERVIGETERSYATGLLARHPAELLRFGIARQLKFFFAIF
jgi:hypothetical protein